jgi:hypothetical protein
MESQGVYFEGDLKLSPPRYTTFFSCPKVGYFLVVLSKVQRKNPTLEITFGPDIFNKALIILEDKCVAMINKTLLQLGLPAPVRDRQDILHTDYI